MTEPTDDDDTAVMVTCEPVLPERWREWLADWRRRGIPTSPQHQWAYRNFVRACFPDHVSTTDRDVLDQLEAWWVLTQLPREAWRYWLTAPTPDEAER